MGDYLVTRSLCSSKFMTLRELPQRHCKEICLDSATMSEKCGPRNGRQRLKNIKSIACWAFLGSIYRSSTAKERTTPLVVFRMRLTGGQVEVITANDLESLANI